MAFYHLSAQVIGRSSGRSAVACAAYRAGERLSCRETGTEKDYTRKDKVDEKMILAPSDAPDWVYEREELWNEIHAVEKRKDAQLCREVNVAFPRELSRDAQVELVRNFAQREYVDKGMVADVCCHNLEGKNPHAHIMLSTRVLTPEGFGKKERAWNNKKLLLQQREAWAHHCNKSLEREGIRERIDHRSLKDQGIDREPTIHLGSKPHPERVARLESIRERNRTLKALKTELQLVGSHLNAEIRRERALEQHRKEQAEVARCVAEERSKQAARQRVKDAAFEKQLNEINERSERRAKEDDFVCSVGVHSSAEGKREKEDAERKLDRINYQKKCKEREYRELESQKGLLSIFKNRRLSAEMAEINSEYIKLQKEEESLESRVEKLDKAHEILWERERPEREARDREYARERAERAREKALVDALDPRYDKTLRQYDVSLRKRIEMKKQLAAAPNDQTRDKMLASWQQANQKDLSRGRGRGR